MPNPQVKSTIVSSPLRSEDLYCAESSPEVWLLLIEGGKTNSSQAAKQGSFALSLLRLSICKTQNATSKPSALSLE